MSDYSEDFQNEETNILQNSIARDLFGLIDSLRQRNDQVSYQKRWGWELIQNAQDATKKGETVEIKIELDREGEALRFLHTGAPFKVKDLIALINQKSSKERNKVETDDAPTGQYGTGFITSHLLSERVKIAGILEDKGKPPKAFEIELNRTGEDEIEILDDVRIAMEQMRKLDSPENPLTYFKNRFEYEIDEPGLEVAEVGIEELKEYLHYTLAFSSKIQKVNINDEVVFEKSEIIDLGQEMKLFFIKKDRKLTQLLVKSSSEKKLQVAIPLEIVDNKYFLTQIPEDCPKIFCNFPLIGTEDFKTPFILNSPVFHVYDEKRSGITLTDSNHKKPLENKELVIEAANLFLQMAEYISSKDNYFELYNLARIKTPSNKDWLSKKWYNENILDEIQERLKTMPIVETNNGRIQMIFESGCSDFPSDEKKELREKNWNLSIKNTKYVLPKLEHVHEWYKINWDTECNHWIESFLEHLDDDFEKNLQFFEDKKQYIFWLNELFELINLDEDSINAINRNKYSVFPNQNGNFISKKDAHLEKGEIGEDLKDILVALGEDIREKLLLPEIVLSGEIALDEDRYFNKQKVAIEIKNRVRDILSISRGGDDISELQTQAFSSLYNWLVDKGNGDAEDLFDDLYRNKHLLWSDEVIASMVERSSKVSKLMEKYDIESEDELEEILASHGKKERQKKELTESDFLAYGITTQEQLDKLIEDGRRNFTYTSSGSVQMFEKVQEMIARSVENVKAKLSEMPEYSIEEWNVNVSVITGVEKRGHPITIVARPSDYNTIIIYYQNERDALESIDSELWADNDSDQEVVTLGKIFKKNKINKFSI